MLLTVKHNNEVTKIAIDNGNAHTERKCVEFMTDQFRIYNDDELLTISKSSFNLVSPFQYCVLIERYESINNDYIFEIFNYNRSRDWLLYGDGGFRLDNVVIRIEDNDMITVEVPEDATVCLDDEEIHFEEYAVVNNEQVTNKE